jgi:hypothetical protein
MTTSKNKNSSSKVNLAQEEREEKNEGEEGSLMTGES